MRDYQTALLCCALYYVAIGEPFSNYLWGALIGVVLSELVSSLIGLRTTLKELRELR